MLFEKKILAFIGMKVQSDARGHGTFICLKYCIILKTIPVRGKIITSYKQCRFEYYFNSVA